MEVVFHLSRADGLDLLVEGRTETRWSGRFCFLPAGGRREAGLRQPGAWASPECRPALGSGIQVEGKELVPGEDVYCKAGALRWSYRIVSGFQTGGSAYAVLGDIAFLPHPWPERPPTVRLEAGTGVVDPVTGNGSVRWMNQLVFWGEFTFLDNLRIARGFPEPLQGQRYALRRIESYFVDLFGFHPFPDALHFLFPVLPPAGPGGFA